MKALLMAIKPYQWLCLAVVLGFRLKFPHLPQVPIFWGYQNPLKPIRGV